MCCGGNCNGNCNSDKSGNFTYVRFATNDQGSNISKYIDKDNNGNIDGLTRCYQCIFVSPIPLDENSLLFPTHFTEWAYVCDDNCGCNSCEWFDYHKTGLGNRWSWESGVLTNDSTITFQNIAEGINGYNGDIMTIPFFTDSDNNLLQSGLNYCFEFKFDPTLFTNPDSKVEIKFGNGSSTTTVLYDQTNITGLMKLTITPIDGVISSHTMVIRLVNDSSPIGTEIINFRIFNFRLAPESCCQNDCGCNCDITMKPLELILGEEINFVHTDFGSEIDIIEAGQTEINRGVSQSIYNSAIESSYQIGSPANTEWNSIYSDPSKNGFVNLLNIKERIYTDFVTALDNSVGANIIGLELVMHDLSTDKYYKFLFSSWTQGDGGGFAYTRQEIDVTELCKITFSDGTVQNTAAGNVVGGDNITVQEIINDGVKTFVVNSSNNTYYSDVAFVDLYYGDNLTAELGNFGKPFNSVLAAQTALINQGVSTYNPGLVYLRKGQYSSNVNLYDNVHIYCEPGVLIYYASINASFINSGQYSKFFGYAKFMYQSNVFIMNSNGEVDFEFDSADCAGLVQVTNSPKVRISFNYARLSGMNGSGYSFRITDNCDITITAKNYIYSQHIMFFLRMGVIGPFSGRLIVNSPRLCVLNNYNVVSYGDVNKCILTTFMAGECYVELNCPDIRMIHPNPGDGDYQGLICINNQPTGKPKIVINGNLYGNNHNCIRTGYNGLMFNLKLNGNLVSNINPINSYYDDLSDVESNLDISDGTIQGLDNILGVNRKHTFKNVSFYNESDGALFPNSCNISWQNDSPALNKRAQFYNCIAESNGVSSEFMKDANAPSQITIVSTYSNKPLGSSVTPDFSDYQVVSSLKVPKE